MKPLALLLLPLLASTYNAAGFGGPGPWANSTPYPGFLDGKYQAAVTGQNTSGVLSFAIRDGAAPFLQIESQSAGGENVVIADVVAVNQDFALDRSLNYYAVFVNGRAYVGSTAAGINYDSSTVSGTLIGSAPTTITNTTQDVTSQLITNISPFITTNTTSEITSQLITNTVPIIVTNTSNSITSTNITTVVKTNETIVITNSDGVVTETNVFYDLVTEQTVFFTNTIEIPEVIRTNEVVETVFFTNSTSTPVIVTNTTVETVFFTNIFESPASIATGVDGAFQANITGKRGIFTFQGPGQLSSPGPVIDGRQVNPVMNFNVNGIRVSFSSQATFQQLTSSQAAP